MAERIPTEVRDWYDKAPVPHRTTMLAMRAHILEILPDAQEVVSYNMPAFRVDGVVVAGLMAAKNHVGYYPFSGSVLHHFVDELSAFKTSKSAIQVPIETPLNKTLIKKLLRKRISQIPR